MTDRRDLLVRLEDTDTELAALVQSGRVVSARSSAARQLVKWRIRRTLSHRPRRARALRPFVVAALLLASGAVLGATALRTVQRLSRPAVVPAEAPHTRHARAAARAVREPTEEPPPPEASPVDVPAPEASPPQVPPPEPTRLTLPDLTPIEAPRAATPRRRPEAPAPETAPPPTTLVPPPAAPSEQALLRAAVARLRVEQDPAGALEALDEHAAAYPHGAMAPEALALRAEALVQLGLRREALRVLDDPALASMPGADARRALHGELLAGLGRWRQARSDFDRVIATGGDDGAVERALWGRAAARERLGDSAGARADLSECLRRFPRGQFATRAAKALEGLP
jgi:TolA-binding protein